MTVFEEFKEKEMWRVQCFGKMTAPSWNRIRIVKTRKDCSVKKFKIYAIRNDVGWLVQEQKIGWEIPLNKLYHPMARYFKHPSKVSYFICKMRMLFWKHLMVNAYSNGRMNDNCCGIFGVDALDGYFFHYCKNDYRMLLQYLSGKKCPMKKVS